MCERTNTTYLDCPVAKIANATEPSGNFSFGVAIHNPSNIEMVKAEIRVPQGTYRAIGYNISSGLMQLNLTVEQRCHHDYWTVDKVNQTIENCVLFINQEVPARGMALVEVICDALADPNLEIEDVFGFNQKPEFKGVNPELESKLLSNLTVLQN